MFILNAIALSAVGSAPALTVKQLAARNAPAVSTSATPRGG
jgi:hypothetical protein